ncbi:unnamed protein product [Moneuplotes crassus]|uniref:Uncharacterized protein n=1 Tax=Euplotes crassus TaxID=5936 RepID=A0AAD2D854_EUPCR|nr:unnamed protein product [Moneuplotes crassus]
MKLDPIIAAGEKSKKDLENTFHQIQKKKEGQEIQYQVQRNDNLKKEIHSFITTNGTNKSYMGYNIRNLSPNSNPASKYASNEKKANNMNDILKAQIEEKKLLEMKQKLKDQTYSEYIQRKDSEAESAERKSQNLYRQAKVNYLQSLKEQMREQQQMKYSWVEMDEREKKINRQKLKELARASPDRYRRKAQKLEALSLKNTNKIRDEYGGAKTDRPINMGTTDSVDNIKTLDFTNDAKMPKLVKKEVRIQKPPISDPKGYITDSSKDRTPRLPLRNSQYGKSILTTPPKYEYQSSNEGQISMSQYKNAEDKSRNRNFLKNAYSDFTKKSIGDGYHPSLPLISRDSKVASSLQMNAKPIKSILKSLPPKRTLNKTPIRKSNRSNQKMMGLEQMLNNRIVGALRMDNVNMSINPSSRLY